MKHFEHSEFDCKCGRCDLTGEHMDAEHLEMLDEARELAGLPFIVESGLRCPDHNRAVGGSETSSHLTGYAVDIRCSSSRWRYLMTAALKQAGFNRIGLSKTFIHVDNDPEKPERVEWLY